MYCCSLQSGDSKCAMISPARSEASPVRCSPPSRAVHAVSMIGTSPSVPHRTELAVVLAAIGPARSGFRACCVLIPPPLVLPQFLDLLRLLFVDLRKGVAGVPISMQKLV